MKNPFDKQIHADEFKLRLLLTNGCNYNCSFCLNDFQDKPIGQPLFLDMSLATNAIEAYASCIKGYPLQVYFSGGEPTLHPGLCNLISFAKHQKCRVTLNTNGCFSDEMENKLSLVDCMHFGVYKKDEDLAKRIKRMNGSVQCVYSVAHPYVDFNFLKYYLDYGLDVKVFGDLHEDPIAYTEFAKLASNNFPGAPLFFRFIGVQENRGKGCNNCDRHCVTLKGAWVFSNGQISHCPQKCRGEIYSPITLEEWSKALKNIEEQHRVESKIVDVDLTEEGAFSWPDPELEGWRFYRIEYGGCNENCYYEGHVWLPPEADSMSLGYKLFEILQVPEARQELNDTIERIHKEKVGKKSHWEESE